MSIDSTWLRCPNCFLPLSSVDDVVLGCDGGHRFDISRHGTVTLLPPRAPKTIGDTRRMLEARRDLLDSGLFAPIAESIVAASIEGLPAVGDPLRIADLGCGTGYYADRLAQTLSFESLLAADRSPIAVRMATLAIPRSTGVVLDLWRPLPLRDDIADLAINVFAPRNPNEFARVIRRGGILIVVVPTTGHLSELRTSGDLLDIPAGKDARVTAQLVSAGFSVLGAERVEYHAAIDAAQRAELVGMGPSAHHAAVSLESSASGAASPTELVTVSVDVLAFRRDAED
jgi:23S rRNA (guanine745-N1)-methyltransferase